MFSQNYLGARQIAYHLFYRSVGCFLTTSQNAPSSVEPPSPPTSTATFVQGPWLKIIKFVDSLLSLPGNKSKARERQKSSFPGDYMGRAGKRHGVMFCFLKTMWYHRGNVVHIQPQEEKTKDNSRLFGPPGNAYRPPRSFPSPREGKEEISRIKRFSCLYGR